MTIIIYFVLYSLPHTNLEIKKSLITYQRKIYFCQKEKELQDLLKKSSNEKQKILLINQLAQLHIRQKDFEGAEDILRKAIRNFGYERQLLNSLLLVFRHERKIKEIRKIKMLLMKHKRGKTK